MADKGVVVLTKVLASTMAPYLYMALFAALAAGAFGIWYKGNQHGQTTGKALVAEQIERQYHDELVATKAEAKLVRELNMDLTSRLAQVPSSTPVKEAVRANPTNCPLAPAVTDSLRQQAANANSARTSGKRNGSLPPAR